MLPLKMFRECSAATTIAVNHIRPSTSCTMATSTPIATCDVRRVGAQKLRNQGQVEDTDLGVEQVDQRPPLPKIRHRLPAAGASSWLEPGPVSVRSSEIPR